MENALEPCEPCQTLKEASMPCYTGHGPHGAHGSATVKASTPQMMSFTMLACPYDAESARIELMLNFYYVIIHNRRP